MDCGDADVFSVAARFCWAKGAAPVDEEDERGRVVGEVEEAFNRKFNYP